jgi:hypothetical protein
VTCLIGKYNRLRGPHPEQRLASESHARNARLRVARTKTAGDRLRTGEISGAGGDSWGREPAHNYSISAFSTAVLLSLGFARHCHAPRRSSISAVRVPDRHLKRTRVNREGTEVGEALAAETRAIARPSPIVPGQRMRSQPNSAAPLSILF